MSAHTPGPWEIRSRHADKVSRYVRLPDGTEIVVSELSAPISAAADENARANVRLIAAAPELVDVLQKTTLCLDDMEKVNALLNRDTMAATCLVISNEIRNALIKAGVT